MTPRHRRRLGVFVGIALLIPLAAPWAASGDPIDEKRAEAARIQDQLDAQGTKLSIAAERFNRARNRLAEVKETMAKAEADVRRSDERMAEIRARLQLVAIAAYVGGGSSPASVLNHMARAHDDTEYVVKRQYLKTAAGDQRSIMSELKAAKEDLNGRRARLAEQEKDAEAAAEAADATRRAAQAAEDAQRAILSRVQGDLADLVAAENARRLAAEAARAPAAVAATPPPPGFDDAPARPEPTPVVAAAAAPEPVTAPPPSSKAAVAVETARAQIGKPYVWGGSGPDGFDCSGLTSYAWAAAGVYLSHDAYAQYFETTRVPVDQVEPGDLLFFGSDVEGIHHNAIYVGGGQMIEASQTGVPVRYRGWRAGDLVGAGRPS